MKKLFRTMVAAILAVGVVLSFTACNGKELNFGKKLIKVNSQLDVLTELKSGTADVGIMDSIMANYYTKQDNDYNTLQVVENLSLAKENYGIAGRKNSQLLEAINLELVKLKKNGELNTIATRYSLATELNVDDTYTATVNKEEADYKYIMGKGKVIIGYTVFAPIAYENANKEFVGFDIDLAKKVCEGLGIEAIFQKVDWDSKELELGAKNIDLIWNGLTITDERKASMEISIPYLKNQQVAVIKKTDKEKYTTTASMKKAVIAAESGSAGQACVEKK